MLYRVKLDLPFISLKDAQALVTQAKLALPKVTKMPVVGNNLSAEASFIEIHKCYHDEILSKPCEIIERIEL